MSEASEARRIGAKLTKNSGRGQYQKGDAILDIFTLDFKESRRTFGLSQSVWQKVCTDAMKNGITEPALIVILGDAIKTRLAVVSLDILEDYVRLRQKEEHGNI